MYRLEVLQLMTTDNRRYFLGFIRAISVWPSEISHGS